MSKVDWSVLGTTKRGLAVEGKDDKTAIEAFLTAGERQQHWSGWRAQIEVIAVENTVKVLREVSAGHPRVWGLIDRDWRTDKEIQELQTSHPHLLILPRVTIENYCINPDELDAMMPEAQRVPDLKAKIELYLDDWVQNGALWQILHDNGAHDFCRGHETGYPRALLHHPITSEVEIKAQFQRWYDQLDPARLIPKYQQRVAAFRADPAAHYTRHLHGKHFFNQVVVDKILNHPGKPPRDRDSWFDNLFRGLSTCPADMIPILKQVFP